MDRHQFDIMNLPKSTGNESLESESRNMLALLLGTELFESRTESERDKGVDLTVELKNNGCYTNFRFAVQLKSTKSDLHADGSLSFQIEVTNLNYLLNYAPAAYYILYHQPSKVFYFKSALDVQAEFIKQAKGEVQKTISIRFSNKLNKEAILDIHSTTLYRGLMLRNLIPFLQVASNYGKQSNIVIDEHLEIYTVEEKIILIENYGPGLLNKAEFLKIIEIEKQCFQGKDNSARFHLVCGQAHFQVSDFYIALDHFKKASLKRDELHPELQVMLIYYTESSKYSLGIIGEEAFQSIIQDLMKSEYLGLFLKIKKAYEDFFEQEGPSNQKLIAFIQQTAEILKSKAADCNLNLIAKAYLLALEGSMLTDELMRVLFNIKLAADFGIKDDSYYQSWKVKFDTFFDNSNATCQAAHKESNIMAFNNITIEMLKVRYQVMAFTTIIDAFDPETEQADYQLNETGIAIIEEQCSLIEGVEKIYREQQSVENLVVALSQKYQILHFGKLLDRANVVQQEIQQLIKANDLNALQRKFDFLTNAGTNHEMLIGLLKKHFEQRNHEKKQQNELLKEMQSMDDDETRNPKTTYPQKYLIELFGLGHFIFPREKTDQILQLLNINEEQVKSQYKNMLTRGMVPVANVYVNPIEKEGYGNGNLEYKGFESVQNIHRIRKAFYENKYYRVVSMVESRD